MQHQMPTVRADEEAAEQVRHGAAQPRPLERGRRAEMDAFYALANEDDRQLAAAADWTALLAAPARPGW